MRFGVLALAWTVVGYFSPLGIGLGWALTNLVAEKPGNKGQDDEIPSLVWTAMSMMTVLGVLGGVVIAAAIAWVEWAAIPFNGKRKQTTLSDKENRDLSPVSTGFLR